MSDVVVSLDELARDFEAVFSDCEVYLNKKTGEVLIRPSAEILWPESEELPDEDNLERLPDKFEVNEKLMMEEFVMDLEDEESAKVLASALRSRHPYSAFRYQVKSLALADDWYKFRDEGMKGVLRRWCRDNDIAYK